MKTSDFYFDLPQELIAQTPLQQRDASRLLCLGRTDGSIAHRHFHELPALLRPGDLLVMNDSRVMPSRLIGEKEGTGGAIEFLLLEQRGAIHEIPSSCTFCADSALYLYAGTRSVSGTDERIFP